MSQPPPPQWNAQPPRAPQPQHSPSPQPPTSPQSWQQPPQQHAAPPQHPGPPAPTTRRNVLGLVALAVAILMVLAGIGFRVAVEATVVSGLESFDQISQLYAISAVVQGLLSVVAVVLGVIALLQRGRGRAAAGAAVGIGAASLASILANLLVGALGSLG